MGIQLENFKDPFDLYFYLREYFVIDTDYPLGSECIANMKWILIYQDWMRNWDPDSEDEPIQVCPECKTNEYFDTEWGLWCPRCQRELKESELGYGEYS